MGTYPSTHQHGASCVSFRGLRRRAGHEGDPAVGELETQGADSCLPSEHPRCARAFMSLFLKKIYKMTVGEALVNRLSTSFLLCLKTLQFCSFSPFLFLPFLPFREDLQRMYIAVKEWLFRNSAFVQNFLVGRAGPTSLRGFIPFRRRIWRSLAQGVCIAVCQLGGQTVKPNILSSSTLEFANPEPGLIRRQVMAPAGRFPWVPC